MLRQDQFVYVLTALPDIGITIIDLHKGLTEGLQPQNCFYSLAIQKITGASGSWELQKA